MAPRRSAHEPAADEEQVDASPRTFGLTFAAVFAIVAVWPLWNGGVTRVWSAVVSAAFLVAAIVAPRALATLSRLWQAVGLLLHHVVNPVVMGALFFLAVTPFGLLVRWRNPTWAARFRIDRSASTYWIPRSDAPASMRQQF